MSFIESIVLGVLSNAVYDGAKYCTKKVFSSREIDFELRRAVSNIQERQTNIEGLINRLVENQGYMISLFLSVLEQFDLSSQIYLEGDNIVVLPDEDDLSTIKLLISSEKDIQNGGADTINPKEDRFSSYHAYVKKMRGEE